MHIAKHGSSNMSSSILSSEASRLTTGVRPGDGASHARTARFDVLIAGFGPVGAALANLLGAHGVHTLVIDRARDVYLAPRAIALDNEALRILQLAGLDEDAFERIAIPTVELNSPLALSSSCLPR